MKKIVILSLCLCMAFCGMGLLPAVSRAQVPVIDLPAPQVTDYGRPLMDCLRDRMSQRTFSTEMLRWRKGDRWKNPGIEVLDMLYSVDQFFPRRIRTSQL